MTQSTTDYLKKKQLAFIHKMESADRYSGYLRSIFQFSTDHADPVTEQGLREISGDLLARLADPIPAMWDELGRRAANVSDPKQEYAFLQAVGTEAMLCALQDTLLLLRSISENAEAIKAGIKHLDEAKKFPPGVSHQTLTELERLLVAINLAAVDNNQADGGVKQRNQTGA